MKTLILLAIVMTIAVFVSGFVSSERKPVNLPPDEVAQNIVTIQEIPEIMYRD